MTSITDTSKDELHDAHSHGVRSHACGDSLASCREAGGSCGLQFDSVRYPNRSASRVVLYGVVAALVAGMIVLGGRSLGSAAHSAHSSLEMSALILAFFVGALSLVRFYSRKDYTRQSVPCFIFLFLAASFLGAALFDGFHALAPELTGQAQETHAWSWYASRLFLSLMLFCGISWNAREVRRAGVGRSAEFKAYGTVAAAGVLGIAALTLVPLGPTILSRGLVARPLELIPAVLFGLAVNGYRKRGNWRNQPFEHWMIVSLIFAVGSQVAMALSAEYLDGFSTTAQLLKLTTYLLVVTGLFISMGGVFRESRHNSQELERSRSELRSARDEAIRATNAKSVFLANMSHEIRTPLHGILGTAQLLLDSGLDDDQREYAEASLSSAQNLLGLINGVLDLSKIEAGKLELETIPFDVRELVRDLTWQLSMAPQAQGLDVEATLDATLPATVVGDPSRLRQVLTNLAGNAIKFTDTGGSVNLAVEVATRSGDEVRLRFSVVDTGCGIPEEKLTHVFGSFEQADNSVSRNHGGTGLGLAISDQIVDLMGGSIEVDSTVGEGSTFSFTVSLATVSDEAVVATDAGGLDRTLWIVGGHAVQVAKVRRAVQRDHWDAVEVTSIPLALDRLNTDAHPAVIIAVSPERSTDFVSLSQISDATESAIIWIAGSGERGDAALARDAGAAAYLAAPMSEVDIREAVDSVTTMSVAGMLVTRHTLREHRETIRVLLAEDSATNRMIVAGAIGKAGHEVVAVENGRLAVEAAAAQEFDVILMDVQMPEMGGVEAAKAIRQRGLRAGRHTPIVALTAHAMEGDAALYRSAGMDHFLSKPFDIEHLIQLVTDLANTSHAKAS